mgnify:FL=1
MINSINISEVASYNADDHVMKDLGRINFVFGANGTGKTTISRVLDNPGDFPTCSIDWEHGQVQTCKVYNVDFVKNTLTSLSEMPGIFTLGQDDSNKRNEINRMQELIKNENGKKVKTNIALQGENGRGGKREELALLIQKYTDRIWKQKTKYSKSLIITGLEGFLGSKARFREKILEQYAKKQEAPVTYDQLLEKASTVFDKNVSLFDLIPEPDFTRILKLAKSAILIKKIVGKEDVDISEMVKKLGNNDWVKSGMVYLDRSEGICPFCQRSLEKDFRVKLEEYFDDSYVEALREISSIKKDYSDECEEIILHLNELLNQNLPFIDNEALSIQVNSLSKIFSDNLKLIEYKYSHASEPVELVDCNASINIINNLIKTANEKISNHNEMTANIESEKKELSSQIWKFVTYEIKDDITDFVKERVKIENEITGLEQEIKKIDELIKIHGEELTQLQNGTTGVEATRNAINEQLEKFGYTGFRLGEGMDRYSYSIVRDNGQVVNDTLSEGEQNFITFLYFYFMLKGSLENTGTIDNKVVVIDDPVSSMDSDALFIISSLIRDLFSEICEGKGNIVQLFIMSHNLYFYKEVSFTKGFKKGITRQMKYWVVQKRDGFSSIESRQNNPVSSTYEVLWERIKTAKKYPESCNINGLQNTMRRILEHYYKYYGGISLCDIPNRVNGDYRWITKSLISWTNAGSHSSFDDVCCSPLSEGSVEKNLDAFRMIFLEMGHLAHYNMMMGLSEEETDSGQAENV